MKYFQSHGNWWLPSIPENQLSGELSFSKEEGITLKVIGKFEQGYDFSKEIFEVIHGFTENNIVTLFNCSLTNQELKIPSQVSTHHSSYSVRLAVLGEHLSETLENATFEKTILDYTYFSHWANLSTFRHNFANSDKGGKIERIKCDFLLHDHISAEIDSCTFRILQCCHEHPSELSYSLDFSCLLEISFVNQLTLDEIYSSYLSPIQAFLDFATQKTNRLRLFQVFHQGNKLDIIISEIQCEEIQKTIKKRDFLFTLEEVQAIFPLVISKWLDLYKKIPDILNLYFSAINNNSLYIDNQFLFICQSLEGYHRRRIDRNTKSHTKLKEIIKNLFEKHKFILQGLTTEYEKQNPGCIKEAIDRISKKVVALRNYQSHLDDRSQDNILHGEKLFRVTQILELLFESILLTECGFSDNDVETKIKERSDFTYLRSIFRSLDFLNS